MNNNAVQFRATFDAKAATDHSIQMVVAQMLKLAGCPTCGRLSVISVQFMGDPGPELTKVGVTGLSQEAIG